MRKWMSFAVLLSLWIAGAAVADVIDCGTSLETEQRIRALHERPRERQQLEAQHAGHGPAAELRGGAFFLQADSDVVPGYHPFDLGEKTLIFEPRGAKFVLRHAPLQYVEPAGAPVADFTIGSARSIEQALPFTFPFAGRQIDRIYITAFDSIEFDPPREEGAMQIDVLEAAVHRNAVVAPLLTTRQKPSRLAFPQVFVDATPAGAIVTWRSTLGKTFGYDVQAELRNDGTIVFSYRTPRAMRWGAPVISTGFDPESAPRTTLRGVDDTIGDATSAPAALQKMLDVVRADVSRIGTSEVYALTLKLAEPVDAAKLASDQFLRYYVTFEGMQAVVDVLANGTTRVLPFDAPRLIEGGAAARVAGDTIELYGLQPAPSTAELRTFRVATYLRPTPSGIIDTVNFAVPFDAVKERIAVDLSLTPPETELSLPIVEPFVLAPFNPFAVYEKLQAQFRIGDHELDAVAMFQSFYTDLIFWAGAYAIGGNPQVGGISATSNYYGPKAPRAATLLHMNQLEYGYFEKQESASQVMLHELGHRWLYFFRIKDGQQTSSVLNPTSAHPAAYVDTRSAFQVYRGEESSVMGGAYFTQTEEGTWKATAANSGFSWTDLYLMGLASAEEVRPWFYLADTDPALPLAYWPQDGIVVSGSKKDVNVQQIIDVHGPRIPQIGAAQKQFRVAFVLVTEPGVEPAAVEVAKLNEWRALFERDFLTATGGRGSVRASFTRVSKKRAAR